MHHASILILALALVACGNAEPAQLSAGVTPADMVIRGGPIITVDPHRRD